MWGGRGQRLLLPLLTEGFSNSINFADLQTGSHPGPLKEPFRAHAQVKLPRPPLRGAERACLPASSRGGGDRVARGYKDPNQRPQGFSPTEAAPEDSEEAGSPGRDRPDSRRRDVLRPCSGTGGGQCSRGLPPPCWPTQSPRGPRCHQGQAGAKGGAWAGGEGRAHLAGEGASLRSDV